MSNVLKQVNKSSRTVTIESTVEVSYSIPKWVALRLEGKRIDAIKELRDHVARQLVDDNGNPTIKLSLSQAMDIVDSFEFLSVETLDEKEYLA